MMNWLDWSHLVAFLLGVNVAWWSVIKNSRQIRRNSETIRRAVEARLRAEDRSTDLADAGSPGADHVH